MKISDRKQQISISEVERLKKIVQDNEEIQERVTKNLKDVDDELGQVEVLMKGMKSDILQFRYALDGMAEYHKELDIINDYCTVLTRKSKNIERGSLLVNPKAYLDAVFDIYTAFEFITNHPNLKERAKLVDMQNNVIKRLVDECTSVLAQLLKGEKVTYVSSETNFVDSNKRVELFNTYFGIDSQSLTILQDISSTLRRCGKYGFMNDCRTFMTMFLKRSIRGVIDDVKTKYLNKPDVEITAHVYYHILKYLEIEYLLSKDLFGADNQQFAKIAADALTLAIILFIDMLQDSLTGVQDMLNRPITEETNLSLYISELCNTVSSCSIFIDYIGREESRYQTLFSAPGEIRIMGQWNSLISEIQSDCSQLMRLVLEIIDRNEEIMNSDATVSTVTTYIVGYLRSINRYGDKLNTLALHGFTCQFPVILSDSTLSPFNRYSASLILSLRQYLLRSTQSSTDIPRCHLYLTSNYYFIIEGLSSSKIFAGEFITSLIQKLYEDEFNAYLSVSWSRLQELAQDRINPPIIGGKSIQSEHRRYIKNVLRSFNEIYDQLIPSQFFIDVPAGSLKTSIMTMAEAMLKEYRILWQQYKALPFSLHHRKRYLLHDPDEVENEIHALFTKSE